MGFRVVGPWLLYNMLKLTGCDVRQHVGVAEGKQDYSKIK